MCREQADCAARTYLIVDGIEHHAVEHRVQCPFGRKLRRLRDRWARSGSSYTPCWRAEVPTRGQEHRGLLDALHTTDAQSGSVAGIH